MLNKLIDYVSKNKNITVQKKDCYGCAIDHNTSIIVENNEAFLLKTEPRSVGMEEIARVQLTKSTLNFFKEALSDEKL